jgi:hypothetical protein
MGAQEEEGARTDWAPMTWAHTEEGTHEEGTHEEGTRGLGTHQEAPTKGAARICGAPTIAVVTHATFR